MADLQDDPQVDPAAGDAVGEPPDGAISGAPSAVSTDAAAPAGADERTDPTADPTASSDTSSPPEAAPPPAAASTSDVARILEDPVLARARELLSRHPVADGYSGLARGLNESPWCDLEHGDSLLETDIPRLRHGGVGAQFVSLLVPSDASGDAVLRATLEQIELVRSLVASCPEGLSLAFGADDMADARNRGRVATLLGPAAGAALAGSLSVLRAYRRLGVRSVTLAGADPGAARSALTPFGHEAVLEMNRLGILVDLSGCSPDTMRRTLTIAKAPAVLSHHPGDLSDEVLRQLRANRGVYMVLCTASSIRETADRLDGISDTAGVETVALSGAFDTGSPHAPGLKDVSCFPRLIAELLDRNWPEADIAAITWGNTLRVLRAAEFVARAAA
ncbi:membrane dipeptidase [Streptomyces sp. HNM0663]|uniref:Membrane dipeptidase n=1 Tax=Streptomyces chengmaiensis TaxID=3040919 RepID=A0ABT6HPR1_9ACTN|nr:membrane dipeptidase [Streptomyces chengmaiensis]MDH2389869.1 membrane dipeptidase [Streptomyces chengmaiensis]